MTRLVAARARSGCRVDLAGGTLDIWPLGLLHAGAITVNVAVSVSVVVSIAPRKRGYRLVVGNRTIEAPDLASARDDEDARFPALLAEHLGLQPSEIRLRSGSPRGAGLGASSALGVALVRCADVATGRPARSAAACAAFVRDVEAQLMGRPTGTQDHYAPLLGGVVALRWRVGGVEAERLAVDLDALGQRLIVAYSGVSHISADTNWDVVRRRLDGEAATVGLFEGIVAAARQLPSALEQGDWQRAGALMASEWRARRQLAAGVTTPEVDRLLAAADAAGAWGGKVCGAGGGGCVAVLAPPERRQAVALALHAEGGKLITAMPTDGAVEARRC